VNSFIDDLFKTGVQCDRKLRFNKRMPFHLYSGVWDSWQDGFLAGVHTSKELACTAKSVRSRVPASVLHVLILRLKASVRYRQITILGKLKPRTGRHITLQFHTKIELNSLMV
jgi:hypothetical protein